MRTEEVLVTNGHVGEQSLNGLGEANKRQGSQLLFQSRLILNIFGLAPNQVCRSFLPPSQLRIEPLLCALGCVDIPGHCKSGGGIRLVNHRRSKPEWTSPCRAVLGVDRGFSSEVRRSETCDY